MGSKVRVVIAALASVIISISSVNTVIAKNKPAQKRDFRAVKTWKQGYKEGWALDRINQVHWRLDKVPLANENAGEGITIYVIDTGVGEEDCNGHGTVVASIAAGSEYGVAPAADIVSVKALNCEGSGTAADVRE